VRRRSQGGEVVWVDDVRAACGWRWEQRWVMRLRISSQAHSKFDHLRLRACGTQMKFMLAAIAQNLRLLASRPASHDVPRAINSKRRNVPPQRGARGSGRVGVSATCLEARLKTERVT